jgi:ferredoxin
MSLFTIDQKECRRDGLCVAECPAKIIEIIGKDLHQLRSLRFHLPSWGIVSKNNVPE